MSCKCAERTGQWHGWKCSITDGACVYYTPDSKRCAEEYGEGPDVERNKCEDCGDFYLEDNKRCCKREPLSFIDGELTNSKYIEEEVLCCGSFSRKE